MNNTTQLNKGILLIALLFAGAAILLFMQSANKSAGVYSEGASTIRKIQTLDANWSVEAMKVRTNPLADFDLLSAFAPEVGTLKEKLSGLLAVEDELSENLGDDINAYISNLNAKEEQLERFKSGYAIIRNSERYLPLAANNIVQLSQNAKQYEIADEVSGLSNEMREYMAAPSESHRARLRLLLTDFSERSIHFDSALSDGVSNFVSHGNVLLDESISTEKLFREATSDKTREEAEILVRALSSTGAVADKEKQNYLYGALGALLASIIAGIAMIIKRKSADPSSDLKRDGDFEDGDNLFVDHDEVGAEVGDTIATDKSVIENVDIVDSVTHYCSSTKTSDVSNQIFAGLISDDLMEIVRKIEAEKERDADLSGYAVDAALSDKTEDSYQHISRIAKKLSSYATNAVEENKEWVNINDVIREVATPESQHNGATVRVKFGDIPHIIASPTELKCLFKNLVHNAVSSVRSDEEQELVVEIETQTLEGQIAVTITDNGAGVDSEKRKNITKLFKTDGNTPLDFSLPSSNYLAKRYGGKLLLNSIPNKGTAVRVLLPENSELAGVAV